MVAKVDELIGTKHGQLTIREKRCIKKVLCECECGLKVIRNHVNITSGQVRDCGTHGKKRINTKYNGSKFGKR